ncbi:hypothetical protein M427DRAFT_55501 [Gonapodya prolifera JEL478]|uniref:Uncharacterized protein n=1 Tax=Gonapodya prolifera (strain JEL478) TaxID=1344416 RepID=A0A139AIB7_GONPJ|nr:hypothetical protein M427DRAFT_55501 [Gonapodya prolifera JEL478]|eukprot:KXS16556.1 hypothetical protein M427DRAFT_55501 [Gonapodya prolifera JEL478]
MPAPTPATPPPIADSDLAFLSRWTGEKDLGVLRAHAEDNWRDMVGCATHIYRCMRRATYLSPRIARYPVYEEMLAAKAEGKRFMEVGCAFGTDVRKVVADGWPAENILAVDITDNYWKLGLSLFQDASTPPPVHTFFGDITDDPSTSSRPDIITFLDAGTHFIYAGAVLHVLSEAGVRAMLTKLYAVLAPGGVLFGLSVGVSEPESGSDVTPPVPWLMVSTTTNVPSPSPATTTPTRVPRVLHCSSSLTRLATSIGFASVKVKTFNIPREVEERVMGQTTEEETAERRALKERFGVERLYLGFEMRK